MCLCGICQLNFDDTFLDILNDDEHCHQPAILNDFIAYNEQILPAHMNHFKAITGTFYASMHAYIVYAWNCGEF